MAVLSSFNYDAWLSLPEPEEQLILLERQNVVECMEQLKLIFDRHDVSKLAGINLLHRHFDASPDERLIERIEVSESITAPSIPNGCNIVPHTWQLSFVDGKVVALPMEFIETKSSTISDQDYEAVFHEEFLTEYFNALNAMSLTNVLGLTIHHRDSLKGSDELAHLDEKSSISRRESILRSSTREFEPGTIPTLWDFRKERLPHTCGGRWTCADCTGSTCNH